MELFSGERFIFDDEKNFIKVISGKIEVYFVNKDAENFRQMFVMNREAGEFILPAIDDFNVVETMIYAAKDSIIEKISPAQIDADEMRRAMENWFENLISLQWLRLLADKGDEDLKTWLDKNIFDDCGDDKENLGEDKIFYDEDEKNNHSQKSEDAAFIVKIVAAAMKMTSADLTLNSDVVKKLDQVGVIRRMIQKQNMQMRFVTLTKGCYKKDSGVLIGYYGENKTLAAMIPTAPDKYKIVTKDFPDGIPIDE